MGILKVKASRISHPGGVFYSFVLNAEVLMKIGYVSAVDRDNGVQRPLSVKRCKDVAKFIDSEKGIFANNIILNLPKESYFEPIEESTDGYLYIPDDEKTAWIVDGQHRLYGFEYSSSKYDLLCSGFIDMGIENEAQIFITINKEQKGISTSVIYDLLPLTKNADYQKMRTQSLIKKFNEDPDSPWFNDIKMLGVGKGLITQATFLQNLEKLIDPNGGVLAPYDEETQYKILNNYFNVFKSVFEDAWGSKKHVLTKTIGIAAMCGVFPKVYQLCSPDLTVENILEVIKEVEDFDFTSSSRGKNTNKVGIQSVVLEFQEALPDIKKTVKLKL